MNDDVLLIVGDVSSAIYNAATLDARLTDLDWVSRCGVAHHAVSDALADAHVVLPFRLFTIFSTEAKALTTLRKLRPRIVKALARVSGRKEWVLRIGRPDPARRQEAARLPGRTSRTGRKGVGPTAEMTGTGFLRKKADTRREEKERAARVKSDATAVFDSLKRLADSTSARSIEPGTHLLIDAAFLVTARKTTTFQKTLARAAGGLLRDGCPVSLTGPWPPYSFASLD